ncbi:hypothetical protein RvY_15645 [Ramazzottius varieornatus]|uniref:Tudor domain-containing protein n=1 Tax=Ramazzottius varieornatus TaxID=947166 RepID=A0A1D1VVN2_RAMVA|nr:hypothetical protein RvY_15645 [Ramazzottius varieornatus]
MASNGVAEPATGPRVRLGVPEGILQGNQEATHRGNGISGPTRGITRSTSMRAPPTRKPVVVRSATPHSDYSSVADQDEADEGVSEDTFAAQRANLAGSTGIGQVAFMPNGFQMQQTVGKPLGYVFMPGQPPLLIHAMPEGALCSPPMVEHSLENDPHKLSKEQYDLLMSQAESLKQGGMGQSTSKPSNSLTSGRAALMNFHVNPNVPTEDIMTPTAIDGPFIYPSPEKSTKGDVIRELMEVSNRLASITYRVDRHTGVALSAEVSHWDMYNSIWLWMFQPSKGFQGLMHEYENCMEKIFRLPLSDRPEPQPPLQLQDVVIFRSELRQIYARGRIYRIKSDQTSALVLLLDYGTMESVLLGSMLRQPAEMEKLDLTVVWRCKMREIDYGFAPEDPVYFNREFEKMMERKDLQALVVGGESDWLDVILEATGKSTENVDLEKEMPKPKSKGGSMDIGRKLGKLGFQSPLVTLPPRKPSSLTNGTGVVTMRLVNVEHAGLLHCCPLKTAGTRSEIRKIHVALMTALKESPEPGTLPEPGVLVAVQHNQQWMRARVLRTEYDATCLLYFVDLGRVGYTPTANIRRLLPEQAEIPALSLMCYVKDAAKALDGFDALKANETARKMLVKEGMLGADVPFKVEKFHRAGATTLGDSDEDIADVSLALPSDGRDYVAALIDAMKSGKYD